MTWAARLKRQLLASLVPPLAGHGFTRRGGTFSRRKDAIAFRFTPSFTSNRDALTVAPYMAVVHDEVERALKEFTDASGSPLWPYPRAETLGTYPFKPRWRGRGVVFADTSVEPVVEFLHEVFREEALPYFERHGSLQGLLEQTRRKDVDALQESSVEARVISALIAAYLLGSAEVARDVLAEEERFVRESGLHEIMKERILALIRAIRARLGG